MIPKFRAWNIESQCMLNHDFIVNTVIQNGEIVRDFSDILEHDDMFILMQSTGLHDKNGKEIFEGDVVKGKSDSFRLSCYGEVYWDEEFCRWRINDKKRNRQYEVDWRWKLQIIGNIHEHPELLNQPNE